MTRPTLQQVSQLYLDFYDWVRSYLNSEEEVLGLTNQIYHLAKVYGKNCFVGGLILGALGTLIVTAWLS